MIFLHAWRMGDGQTPDELLRGNMAAAMARRRLTQPELAARMKALGYKWIRQTVGDVQTGRRSLRAGELYGLAEALDTTLAELLAPADSDGPLQLPLGEPLAVQGIQASARGDANERRRWAVRWDKNGDPLFAPLEHRGKPMGWDRREADDEPAEPSDDREQQ